MTIREKPPVPTKLVHHIGIAVADLDSSIDFYRDLFGLEAGRIVVREDIGVRGCFIPVGDTNLELLEGTGPDSMISIHVRERGEVCASCDTGTHDGADLRHVQVPPHDRVVVEDARGAILAGKDTTLIRKVDA